MMFSTKTMGQMWRLCCSLKQDLIGVFKGSLEGFHLAHILAPELEELFNEFGNKLDSTTNSLSSMTRLGQLQRPL